MIGWLWVSAWAGTTIDDAASAVAAKDWAGAARAYRKLAKRTPEDGELWFQLGQAEHNRGAFGRALDAYRRADAASFRPAVARYNAACAAARDGRSDDAIAWLQRAVDAGFAARNPLTDDPDLASLAEDRRLKPLQEQADQNARPCMYDKRYRAFDFWVGDWDVYLGGVLAGRNVVTSVQDGCAVLENWSSASGGTGVSLNWVDPRNGAWHQNWVSSGGQVIVPLAGGLLDDEMVLTGQTVAFDGATETWRGTWTPNPDGTVRQLLERTSDGETWKVGFDGLYVPHATPPP